ncbi:hypothetical protein BH18ACT2_BH18ACT2_01140 [soil metagenome]
MLVDVRPVARLRGEEAIDLPGALAPIIDGLRAGPLDLSRVRIVCDWIQYRHNFRDAIELRRILPGRRQDGAVELEIAVDLRRPSTAAPGVIADDDPDDRVLLEAWGPTSASCIWDFNRLYWQALDRWEAATGRRYESALPGGASDARNVASVRDLIGELFASWDRLGERDALPDELYVIELGVGNGSQAQVFLDTFRAVDAERGRDYYRRLHYLMCDYSAHVLELARVAVAAHGDHVSSFTLDATRPSTALAFLKFKVFLVYVSNVYDNLPTDEVARIGGHDHLVESRAYLHLAAAERLAGDFGLEVSGLADTVAKLLRLGPQLLAETAPSSFPDVDAAVHFWCASWEALRLQERYVPLAGLDLYSVAPGVTGEVLRPLLEAGGDLRLHVNNGAVASFVDTLPLLHPYGRLACHDIIVTDLHRYRSGFLGPGKYDGSVVNWVNGPLLAHVGHRRGFDVEFEPFRHREGTNIVTMTARVRD